MQLSVLDFDDLGRNDRLNLVWTMGRFVSRVHSFKHTYLLYALFDYYVEVVVAYHDPTNVNQIVAFDGGKRLDKHLNEIDLSDLE